MPDLTLGFLGQGALLIVGGAFAGFVNSLAGGGSFLTVPLLVFVGLPITEANATNRVGVFVQCCTALLGFRQEGVRTLSMAVRIAPALLVGSYFGARVSSSLSDAVFQQIFAVLMLIMLPVILLNPKPRDPGGSTPRLPRPVALALEQIAYLALGVYGGAIQAGIGIPLLLALAGLNGIDLVRANSIKVALVAALTAVALGQFVYAGEVVWTFGILLAIGTGLGGYAAARIGSRVGDRLIRPVMAVAVVAAALRLLLG